MPISNANATSLALISLGATAVTGYIIYKLISTRRKEASFADAIPVRVCSRLEDWVTNEIKFVEIFSEAKVIGMDCEWVTIEDQRNPVALLQLATADGFCVIIRLCNIPPWLMPSGLINLLNDTDVIKVGVGVCEDAQKLLYDYGLTVRGCLDLRQMVQDVVELKGKGLGLQALAEYYLDAKLKKNVELSCSNWEAEHLTPKQVAYAAEDALAAAQIYAKVMNDKRNSDCNETLDKCAIDVPFKGKSQRKENRKVPNNTPNKDIRYKKILGKNKIMYDNCQLQAPDGEPLCSCHKKKGIWYVERGRAELISEDPYIVRLNFEPSARPILDNKYYIQEKLNMCVVCGDTKYFFRKSVVPSEYRRYFPSLMKNNLSHDILVLCVNCHRKSNLLDQTLRQELADECNAPIKSGASVKIRSNKKLASVKSAAKALVKSKDKIPADRKEELENIIKKHYQIETVDEKLLKSASRMDVTLLNKNYVPHGWKVYQHVTKNGGLIQFETRWRKHFLDTMNPKFLPHMWSVNHNHERLALQVLEKKANFDISILGLSQELLDRVKNMKDF